MILNAKFYSILDENALKYSSQPYLLTRLDIKRVGHAEGRRKIGRRKHKHVQPSEEKNWIHPFCLISISCTKVKARVLAFIVI